LRRELKASTEKVMLEPLRDRGESDPAFVAAVVHAARRLKDCEQVAGMHLAFPDPLVLSIQAALALKHPQYRYTTEEK
jgi:hypothetical protein